MDFFFCLEVGMCIFILTWLSSVRVGNGYTFWSVSGNNGLECPNGQSGGRRVTDRVPNNAVRERVIDRAAVALSLAASRVLCNVDHPRAIRFFGD